MNIINKIKIIFLLKQIITEVKKINMSDKLKSRKFWLTFLTAILIILNRALGLGIDDETITKLVGLIIGYDIGQGVADLVGKK